MGLENEIGAIQHKDLSHTVKQAVGVKEVLQCLNGDITRDVMIEEVKKKTRHLAKHQYTWSKQFEVDYVEPDINTALDAALKKIFS